ncbi:MAG TPA: alanine racemase [Thermoanaerobaculia bacterium]|nr:alanine racemase [Thermoanaerobaculia bacterium]
MLTELSTPSFLVDIVRMRNNCVRMREKARAAGVIFRPHVKTHKTIDGARMQHGGGFGPITVSTLAEAEFFAAGGFKDITYAVPIAPEKLWRAAELASRIERLNILIDSETALRAVEQRGHPFDVFLKIDCGYHRAGVSPDNPDTAALARAMLQSKVIRFQGVLTHAGHSYNARNIDDVRRIAAEESACLTRFRALDEDFVPLIRSVGSTPTASVVESFSEVDEVRPGNYVFYDAFQAAIGSCSIDDVAVSVLATVVGSYPDRRSAIIDAGALAMSKDLGADHIDPDVSFGIVCDVDLNPLPVRLTALSQEHGKLEGIAHLPVGTKVRIIPNHSCLTAAMFDRHHVIERGSVVDEWKPVRGW